MSAIENLLFEIGFPKAAIDGILAKPGSTIPAVFLAGGYNVNEYYKKTGIPAHTIVKNASHLIKSQVDIFYRFKIPLLTSLVDLNIMSEAFGAQLYYENDVVPMPYKSAVNNLSEIDKLEIPDPNKDGRMPVILECARLYEKNYKKKGFVYAGVIEGPLTAASNIVGVENLMRGMIKSPKLVNDLLDKVSDALIEFGNAQLENGIDIIGIAEPTASSTVISPEFFKEYSFPYLKKIARKLDTIGTIIHICGYTQPIIEQLIKVPKTLAISVDEVDLTKTLETIGNKFVIVAGNISTSRLLRGTPQEIENISKDCILKAGINGKYVVCPGCDLAPGTPEENILAYINSCKKYGKYPIKV